LLCNASQIITRAYHALYLRLQICHYCLLLLIVSEAQLQIHAGTAFVLSTRSQIPTTTSELCCVARTTTVPPPYPLTPLTGLSFDKVELAFMRLTPSFERTSHYKPYITFQLSKCPSKGSIQTTIYPTSMTSSKKKIPHTITNWQVTRTTYYSHWLNLGTIEYSEETGQLT
jgi:hypothetical protein